MLIVNADDWGRCVAETDAALQCFKQGRVTSVSAMVFMADSERAAQLSRTNEVDVGLHLNFAEQFTAQNAQSPLLEAQARLIGFLMGSRYAQLLYNPLLRRQFTCSCQAQFREFERLYGKQPSHIDGHHHMHLCANMLFASSLPRGSKLRRNFSFWPGEKSAVNRAYRAAVDFWLGRRHRLTDYFFDLTQSIHEKKMPRVAALAKSFNVELMTHPRLELEFDYLMGKQYNSILQEVPMGTYALL